MFTPLLIAANNIVSNVETAKNQVESTSTSPPTEAPVLKSLTLEHFQQNLAELPSQAMNLGIRILLAALVLLIGLQLIKLVRKIFSRFMKRVEADAGATQFLDSLIHVLLIVILCFIIAGLFGMDAASIVAIIGSVGIALGLALQGSLSNLAGGVLILLLKPFEVGDYIKEDSNGNEGTVKKIQIFYTTLNTFDGKTVVLPNGNLVNNSITNFSDTNMRRIDVTVGISYDADIKKAKEALYNLILKEERILNDQERSVLVTSLGDSSVNLVVRFWTKPEDYFTMLWKMTEEVKLELDRIQVNIPYPQMDIHVLNDIK